MLRILRVRWAQVVAHQRGLIVSTDISDEAGASERQKRWALFFLTSRSRKRKRPFFLPRWDFRLRPMKAIIVEPPGTRFASRWPPPSRPPRLRPGLPRRWT